MSEHRTVLVSMEAWQSILAAGVLTVVVGIALLLPVSALLGFIALAIIPHCVRIIHKGSCLRCGIEFKIGEEKEQPNLRSLP